MLKKFAFALTATTICIDVESVFAISKEEREENRSSVGIKRLSPQKLKRFNSLPLSIRVAPQKNIIRKKQNREEIFALRRVKHLESILKRKQAMQQKRINYLERVLKRKQIQQQRQNLKIQLLKQKDQIRAEGSKAVNTIFALKKSNLLNHRHSMNTIRSIRREVYNRINTVQITQKIVQSTPLLQAEVTDWGRKEISLSILGGKAGKITLPFGQSSHTSLKPLFDDAFTRHRTALQAKLQEAVLQKQEKAQKMQPIQQENKRPILAKIKMEKPEPPSPLPVSNIISLHKDPILSPISQPSVSPRLQEQPKKEASTIQVQAVAEANDSVAFPEGQNSVGEKIAATALKVMTFLGISQDKEVAQVESAPLSKAYETPSLHIAPKIEESNPETQNIVVEKHKPEKIFQPVMTQSENKVENNIQAVPQVTREFKALEIASNIIKIEPKKIQKIYCPKEHFTVNNLIIESKKRYATILSKVAEQRGARVEVQNLQIKEPKKEVIIEKVAQLENKIEENIQPILQNVPNIEDQNLPDNELKNEVIIEQINQIDNKNEENIQIVKKIQAIEVNSEVLKIEQKEMVHINLPQEQNIPNLSNIEKNSHTARILNINNEQNNNKITSESMPQIKIEEIVFEENSINQPTLPEKEFNFLSTMLEDLQNRAEKQQSLFTLEKFESSDTGGELYLQSQRHQFSSMKDMFYEVLNNVFSLDEKIKKLNNKYLLNNLIRKLNNNIENTTKALDRLEFTLWKNQGDTPTPKVQETPVIEDNTFETTPIIQSNPLENKLGFFNGILEGLQKRAEEQKLLFTPKKFESSDTGGELYLQSQRNQSSDMKKMYLEILGEISSLENSSNNLSNNSFQEIRINLLKDKLENTRKSIDNLELSLKDNKNETPTPQSTEKSSIQNSSIHFEEDTQVKEENSETTPTMQPSLLREEFNSFNEILGGLLHQAEEQQLNFNPENFNNSSLKGDFYTSTQQQQFFNLQNNYNNYLEDVYSFDNRMNYFLNDNINYQNMNELKSKLEKIKNALDLLKDTLQVEKEMPTPTLTSLPSVETTQEEEIENVKRNTLKIEMEKIKSELEIVQNLASFQKENFSPSKFGPVYIDYQNQFIDALRERLDMPEKQLNMILENVEENSVDQNDIQSSKEKLIKIQESLNEFSFLINNSTTQKNTSEDFNSTQNELSNNENSTPLPEKTTLLTEEETKETSKHLKRVKLESIISDLERLNAKIRNQENMFQTGKFGDVYIDYQIKMLEEFKNQSHVLSETLNELKEEDLSELSKEIEYINLNFRINQLSLNILNDKIKNLTSMNTCTSLIDFQEKNNKINNIAESILPDNHSNDSSSLLQSESAYSMQNTLLDNPEIENRDISNNDSIKLKNDENQQTPIQSINEITLLPGEETTEETTNFPSLQKVALDSLNSELENLEKKLSLQKKNFNTMIIGTFYDDYLVQQKKILESFCQDLKFLSDNFNELIDKDPINNSQLSTSNNYSAFLKKYDAFNTNSLFCKIYYLRDDLENIIKNRNNTSIETNSSDNNSNSSSTDYEKETTNNLSNNNNKKEDDTNLIEKKEPSTEFSHFSIIKVPINMIDLDEMDIKYIKNAPSSQEIELKEINTELENLEKNVLFQIKNFDSEKIEDQKQAHKKFKEYWSNLFGRLELLGRQNSSKDSLLFTSGNIRDFLEKHDSLSTFDYLSKTLRLINNLDLIIEDKLNGTSFYNASYDSQDKPFDNQLMRELYTSFSESEDEDDELIEDEAIQIHYPNLEEKESLQDEKESISQSLSSPKILGNILLEIKTLVHNKKIFDYLDEEVKQNLVFNINNLNGQLNHIAGSKEIIPENSTLEVTLEHLSQRINNIDLEFPNLNNRNDHDMVILASKVLANKIKENLEKILVEKN